MADGNRIHDPVRLAHVMDEAGLDALVASSARHSFYLSGFYVDPAGMGDDFEYTVMLRPALRIVAVFRDASIAPFLVLPSETAPDNVGERASWIADVRVHGPLMDTGAGDAPRSEDPWAVALEALAERGVTRGRVGLEISKHGLNLETVSAPELARLERDMPDVEWVDASALFAELRLVKTPEEIARIEKAQAATDRAVRVALGSARPGMTEIELDRAFRHALVDEGVDHRLTQVTFAPDKWTTIEAWFPTDTRLARGNVVNFDVSARWRMYLSDTGITAVCGKPTADVRRVWNVVRAAYDAVRDAIRPGARASDVYARATQSLRDADLAPCIDMAGHGLGLSIHEGPDLDPSSETLLEPGMVLTDEILVYDKERGIFQAEDAFVVTDTGARALSTVGGELHVV